MGRRMAAPAKQFLFDMKTFRMIGALLVAVCMTYVMVSCGDDDAPGGGSSKGLVGNWYAANLPSSFNDFTGRAYYFKSKNTVVYYNFVANYRHWDGMSQALTGRMSGYYIQRDCGETYTYTVVDNKIYIPTQGVILTIQGNSLYRDGSSMVFMKR